MGNKDNRTRSYGYNKRKNPHTHEFLGSTRLAELDKDPHNHRFAGVTGEAIFVPGGHVHKLGTNTDFYENRFHKISETTGLQKPVGGGRHVHFVEGETTSNDGHRHDLIFATLIENPIGE